MRDIHTIIDQVSDDFYEISERLDRQDSDYDIEKDQPKHFSWVHIWASAGGLATDITTSVSYIDAEEFQQAIVDIVRRYFNTDTLQFIADGKLTMFGMQIGPELSSGGDLNDELGLEVTYDK